MADEPAANAGGHGNPALLAAMRRCGHFLYHRRGGKRSQARILRLLDEWGPGLSQAELQKMLGIQSGSISEILGKMEAGGLIAKERQEGDRRRACLSLTDAGREALALARTENERQEAILFEALGEDEQRQLQALLERLLASWEERFDPELLHGHRCPPRPKEAREEGGRA